MKKRKESFSKRIAKNNAISYEETKSTTEKSSVVDYGKLVALMEQIKKLEEEVIKLQIRKIL